jgi:hypothetical protein
MLSLTILTGKMPTKAKDSDSDNIPTDEDVEDEFEEDLEDDFAEDADEGVEVQND